MKIIYTKHFPPKGYAAINICGLIVARKEFSPISNRLLTHEAIHTAQMREMLYVFFYLWYAVEWLVRLIQYRNTKAAYFNILFEREAYANEHNANYLKDRMWWPWVYIKESC